MSKSWLVALAAMAGLSLGGVARAAVVFEDDFEAGIGNWTQAASPHTLSGTRSVVPAAGTNSAYADSSADRMFNNIVGDGVLGGGTAEVVGPSTFSFYVYDPVIGGTTSTRMYGEVRSYNGDGINDGTTSTTETNTQILAIGKYNSVTTGTYNANKYQARVALGTGAIGWFNLDDAGAPDRSVGWHQFAIERYADGSTLNFYVDGTLSKTVTGAPAASDGWDTLVFGLGAGSTATDANYDGVLVTDTLVPEPSALALLGISAFGLLRRRSH